MKTDPSGPATLGHANRGTRARILSVSAAAGTELELRLLEMGFVEGAYVEILHEGPIGGDPIAVRIDDALVAIRRSEADLVVIG